MSDSPEFERYTTVSCHDSNKPIVPLAFIANKHDGMIPDDGQYVPGEVIARLFDYENAQEQGRMIITDLGIGQYVYGIRVIPRKMLVSVVKYVITEIEMRSMRHGVRTIYTATPVEAEDKAIFGNIEFTNRDFRSQNAVYANLKDARQNAMKVHSLFRTFQLR